VQTLDHVPICKWPRYGDSLRSGWRDIMECVMRLHKLGLVPAVILAVDGEPPEVANCRSVAMHTLDAELACQRVLRWSYA
jgi:hypothetical protein